MALLLVVHDLAGAPEPAARAFFDSIYEIAPEHWPVTGSAVLVVTEVSPRYLRDHLRRALRRAEAGPALLLVSRCPQDLSWSGLPPAGEAWLGEALDPVEN